jgi:hypothetical protein
VVEGGVPPLRKQAKVSERRTTQGRSRGATHLCLMAATHKEEKEKHARHTKREPDKFSWSTKNPHWLKKLVFNMFGL